MNGTRLLVCLPMLVLFCLAGGTSSANEDVARKTYVNGKFGYSVQYPDIFWSRLETDDGITLTSANGHYRFTVRGGANSDGGSAGQILENALRRKAHVVPGTPESGGGRYSLSSTDDGGNNGIEHITFEYGIVTGDAIVALTFSYIADDRFDDAIAMMKASLSLGAARRGDTPDDADGRPDGTRRDLPDGPPGQCDLRNWSPEYVFNTDDHKVYRVIGGDKRLAGEPTRAESGAGAYYWFPVAQHEDGVMRGSRGGIYFFYESGAFVCFLPGDDAEFAGEVRINPNGDQFLIDYGTSPERVLKLFDFLKLEERRVFLAMEAIAWLDPWRFVMTYVDTDKPQRSENAMESGWLSMAIYDTAINKLFLREPATETRNVLVQSVDLENETITILERSVNAPEDWAKERTVKDTVKVVGFPPLAGTRLRPFPAPRVPGRRHVCLQLRSIALRA